MSEAVVGADLLGVRPSAASAMAVGAEGHRDRMRLKLLDAGPEALLDHEMLEMVLFLALPRRDTKSIARQLLLRFGSYANAVSASIPELRSIDGLGTAGVAALKLIRASALRLAKAEAVEQPILNNWARLTDYLNVNLAREKVEQFRVLFLDVRNRLIADEMQGRGTVNHTPVYPREILVRALQLSASAVILVHNHPSGDPNPSRADIEMTAEICSVLRTVAIALHDHVVVGNGCVYSFRREGLL